ncbi:hypothetical protein D3C83_42410 [compost metagenome]
MEYVRTFVPVLAGQLGSLAAMGEIARTARLIGLHYFEETHGLVGGGDFPTYLANLLAAQGEEVALEGNAVYQEGWRLMRGIAFTHASTRGAALEAWAELWRGALAAYDRRLKLSLDVAGDKIRWTVS